ncbi:MAG: PsbP-related protein [Candidatus Gracilibacteria bacterium]
MKKFLSGFLIVLTSLTFSACGSGDDTPSTNSDISVDADQKLYENSELAIAYPQDWEVLERDDFTSNVPFQTIVAMRSNIKNEKFTTNIAVNKKDFEEDTKSIDFAKGTIEQAKNTLQNFKEIESKTVKVKFGKNELDGYLATFQGKNDAASPIVTLKQLYVVNGKTGYMITAAYLSDTDAATLKMIDSSLNSFMLK